MKYNQAKYDGDVYNPQPSSYTIDTILNGSFGWGLFGLGLFGADVAPEVLTTTLFTVDNISTTVFSGSFGYNTFGSGSFGVS